MICTCWFIVAMEQPCHILAPSKGGTMSSRQAPLSFDSFNSTQTLLGSSVYRYHDFAPPIRNKSPLNDIKHESAVKNKLKFMYLSSKYEILFLVWYFLCYLISIKPVAFLKLGSRFHIFERELNSQTASR